MVGVLFVHKVIHLATHFLGSKFINHVLSELFASYESVVNTLEVLLLALLLELMGDVVYLVSLLFPVTVPVRSPYLKVVVKKRKEVHRVLDAFLSLFCSISQEVPACAVDDADVPV